MANETTVVAGSTINAITGAANTITNGSFNNVADVGEVTKAQVGAYPLLKAELRVTFSGTLSAFSRRSARFFHIL